VKVPDILTTCVLPGGLKKNGSQGG